MADVFLSYAHADRQKAQELAKTLAASGWTVFWDRAIHAGPRFRDVIARELESAKCVVVLWSRASVQSDWVIDEAEEARIGGRLVPAVLEAAKPPHGFRGLQTANLVSWTSGTADAEFDLLIGGIEAHAPRATSTEGSTTFATPEDNERGSLPDDEPSVQLAHDAVPPPSVEQPAPRSLHPALMEASIAPPTQLRHPRDTTYVDAGTTARTRGRDTRVLAMAVGALLLAGMIAVAILRNSTVPDDLGFDPRGVVMMEITLPASRYKTATDVTKGFGFLLERVLSMPGVATAAAVDVEPTRESSINSTVAIGPGATPVPAMSTRVLGAYFTVLGIPLLVGRAFNTDQPGLPFAVVSRSLMPDSAKIGDPATVNIGGSNAAGQAEVTIIGLVEDVRTRGAEGTSRRPHIYIPPAEHDPTRRMTVLARLVGPGSKLALQQAVTAFDAQLPTPQVASMEAVVRSSMSQPRFGPLVITLLGISAATLALFALFGLRFYFRGYVPAV
jgi:TIR domain/MacB-like periplasmic core domain